MRMSISPGSEKVEPFLIDFHFFNDILICDSGWRGSARDGSGRRVRGERGEQGRKVFGGRKGDA